MSDANKESITNNPDISPRKFWLLISVIVLIAIVIVSLFVFTGNNGSNGEEKSEEHYSLTKEQQNDVKNTAQSYIDVVGSFGMKNYSSVTGNTAYTLSRTLKTGNSDGNTFYDSRASVYNIAMYNHQFIAEGARISYPQSIVATWDETEEAGYMMQYRVSNVNIENIGEGYYFQDGSHQQAVDVVVSFDSKVQRIDQTATDSSWDGKYKRMSKDFNQQRAQLTLVFVDGKWSIYSQQVDNEFLLATWENPRYSELGKYMFGFTEEETYAPDVSPQDAFKK